MEVRPERRTDWGAVRNVLRCAFGDHGDAVTDLADDLRRLVGADDGLSLVAEDEGEVVGHLMFTRGAWTLRASSSTSRCSAP